METVAQQDQENYGARRDLMELRISCPLDLEEIRRDLRTNHLKQTQR